MKKAKFDQEDFSPFLLQIEIALRKCQITAGNIPSKNAQGIGISYSIVYEELYIMIQTTRMLE